MPSPFRFCRDFLREHCQTRDDLDPLQAGGKESIEPPHTSVRVRPLARQGTQVTERREEFLKLWEIGSRYWLATHPPILFEHCGNDVFPFFWFQRTGAIHDC